MPTLSSFTPLQWKNGINPRSQGSFQTFMKQLADWANNIQNQVTHSSNVGSFAGYAFYSGSASSVTATPGSITNWVAGAASGLGVSLSGGTTFAISGISIIAFQATTPADNITYSASLSAGLGGGSCPPGRLALARYLTFTGLAQSGSVSVQVFADSTGSLSACSLGVFTFNL